MALVALSGCSGGSVYGTTSGGGGGGGSSGTAPAQIDIFVSSPTLDSAANTTAEGVTVTALVRDSHSGAISGAQVIFSIPTNNAALSAALVSTDSSGTAQTVVNTGNDPTNRSVTISATAGSVSATVQITVSGTKISLNGPSSTQFNTPTTYTVTLLDSANQGIANQSVTLSSSAPGFTSTTVTTGSTGQATATFTPTSNATTAVLTATSLGIATTQTVAISTDSFILSPPSAGQEIPLSASPSQAVTVTWTRGTAKVVGATVNFSTTRGTLSAASAVTDANGVATVMIGSAQSGPATITASGTDTTPNPDVTVSASRAVEFIATQPASLSLQPDPTSITVGQKSTLTAVVRDASSNLVKNQVVNFSITQGPGSLSPGSATTNSQGIAVVAFTATATSSGSGVEIKAELASDPSINDVANIVVGGAALRIVLGTGNTLGESLPNLYKAPYTVIVTDANGSAVPSKTVNLSLQSVSYYKGTSEQDINGVWVRTDGAGAAPIECVNEDSLSPDPNLRFNGILDDPVNEDLDADGHLDPENVGSVPSSVVTGTDGTVTFDVTYLKDRAGWVKVRLRATTAVSGTEAVEDAVFVLDGLARDFTAPAPPGPDSPYGIVQDCGNPG